MKDTLPINTKEYNEWIKSPQEIDRESKSLHLLKIALMASGIGLIFMIIIDLYERINNKESI